MIIGSKSAFAKEQLLDKKSKGSNWFEAHTNYQDIIDINKMIEIRKIINEIGMKCYCIHSPMTNEENQWNEFCNKNQKRRELNFNTLRRTLEIAENICDYKNPLVVTHMGDANSMNSYKSKEEFKKIFSSELIHVDEYLKKYHPNIIVVVENMLRIWKNNNNIDHVMIDMEKDVIDCFNEIKPSNIKIVLDICHIQGTCNYNRIFKEKESFTTLMEYLYYSKDHLNLIHLSRGKDLVLFRDIHGLPYISSNQEDIDFIKEFLVALKMINYKNPITIETNELNHCNAINYKETTNTLQVANKMLSNLHNFKF